MKEDEHMSRTIWKRPTIPPANRGSGGIETGAICIASGAVIFLWYGFEAAGGVLPAPALALVGGAFLSAGVVLLPVSLVLREIRQAAFEAALRAGEVQLAEEDADEAP
jgi:hypothetical protein